MSVRLDASARSVVGERTSPNSVEKTNPSSCATRCREKLLFGCFCDVHEGAHRNVLPSAPPVGLSRFGVAMLSVVRDFALEGDSPLPARLHRDRRPSSAAPGSSPRRIPLVSARIRNASSASVRPPRESGEADHLRRSCSLDVPELLGTVDDPTRAGHVTTENAVVDCPLERDMDHGLDVMDRGRTEAGAQLRRIQPVQVTRLEACRAASGPGCSRASGGGHNDRSRRRIAGFTPRRRARRPS